MAYISSLSGGRLQVIVQEATRTTLHAKSLTFGYPSRILGISVLNCLKYHIKTVVTSSSDIDCWSYSME